MENKLNKILDHRDIFANHPMGMSGVVPSVPQIAARAWRSFMLTSKIPWPDPQIDIAPGVTVKAEIVADVLPGRLGPCARWIVKCPDPVCWGAEDVNTIELLFICNSCFNREKIYKWLNVELPANREKIEAAR